MEINMGNKIQVPVEKERTDVANLASKFFEDLKECNSYHYRRRNRLYSENPPNFSGIAPSDDGIVRSAGKAVVDYLAKTLFEHHYGICCTAAFGVAGWGIGYSIEARIKDSFYEALGSSFEAIEGLGNLMTQESLEILGRENNFWTKIFSKNYRTQKRKLKGLQNSKRSRGYFSYDVFRDDIRGAYAPGGYQDQMERYAFERLKELREKLKDEENTGFSS
jgi:hypothetical protein